MNTHPVATVRSSLASPYGLVEPESALRLLVIEGSTSDRDLVLAWLEEELPHAVVDVATTLHDALERLAASPHDLVLAELGLPDADGLAVVHAVRTAHPRTALLVLTGRGDGRLALGALAAGAQDYLVKSEQDGPRLATALLHALQRQRSKDESRGDPQLARGLLDALDAPTCAVAADGTVVAVNAAWLAFTAAPGGARTQWGVGANYLRNCDDLVEPARDVAAAGAFGVGGLRSVLAGHLERYQHEYARPGGSGDRWLSVRVCPAEIGGGRGAVISQVDVSDVHRAQLELTHQALHDSLTGLPSRLLLTDRLEQACVDARRSGRQVALAFLDLDHFKRINDSLGHAAGDAVLLDVASRLSGVLREGDTLSRYNGDEFVIVWRDLEDGVDLGLLGARLSAVLAPPFDLGGTSAHLSASIGLAAGRPGDTADGLLMAADAAMYAAKRQGGATLRVFTDELRQGVVDLMNTEAELRAALTRSELVLHYQPVIDLDSGRPVAVEALARWEHPERGLLPPSEFIPVAESGGLIVPLGRWAIDQACRDAAAFSGPARGLDVAVNLSVRQLTQPDIVDHVRDTLQRTGLAPERLMLEVTESVFMHDADAAAEALNGLARLGIRIAIDDFGTGYSSLLYLRRYPISALKLDRAFVSGIDVSLNDEAICRSVVGLAHAVGAVSIAEGVETVEQLVALQALGCGQGQGFLWSPGVPAAELSQVLTACASIGLPGTSAEGRRRRGPVLEVAPALLDRVEALRRQGASAYTIAAALNRAGTPGPRGSRWSATSVERHIPALAPRKPRA